jgi:hypothetical protein
MFMKGVDRADQYLSYYSLLRKTVNWTKKVELWIVNCALYNSFRIHKVLNLAKQLKYKIFLLQVAKAWAEDKMEAAESQSDTDSMRPGPLTPTPRRPHVDLPGRLSGDMRKHVLMKIVKCEHAKMKHPVRQCHVCAAHNKKSITVYIFEFCVMPLHKGECFQKYHTVKHF